MNWSDFKYYGLLVIVMFFWGLSWPLAQITVGQARYFNAKLSEGFFNKPKRCTNC